MTTVTRGTDVGVTGYSLMIVVRLRLAVTCGAGELRIVAVGLMTIAAVRPSSPVGA